MGLEPIPPISPRSRWEPPLAPDEIQQAAGERDTAGGAYPQKQRRRRRTARAQPPTVPPPDADEDSGGHHIDVRA